jgi:hypothetical protein
MSNNNNIPTIPTDWIAHSGIIPEGNGFRTRVHKVLHSASAGSYHPFVVHRAYVVDGRWAYESGRYCMTLEEGRKVFESTI